MSLPVNKHLFHCTSSGSNMFYVLLGLRNKEWCNCWPPQKLYNLSPRPYIIDASVGFCKEENNSGVPVACCGWRRTVRHVCVVACDICGISATVTSLLVESWRRLFVTSRYSIQCTFNSHLAQHHMYTEEQICINSDNCICNCNNETKEY